MRDKVIARAPQRGDKWGDVVLVRTQSVIDLVAAKPKYHKQCYVQFFSSRITGENARGRPEDAEKQSAFDSAFLYENDECKYSLAELEERMNEEGKSTYSTKHLKEKLLAEF